MVWPAWLLTTPKQNLLPRSWQQCSRSFIPGNMKSIRKHLLLEFGLKKIQGLGLEGPLSTNFIFHFTLTSTMMVLQCASLQDTLMEETCKFHKRDPCWSKKSCIMFKKTYLLMPRYSPGHVCIFLSGAIFHAVSHWTAKEMGKDDLVTPGRVGSVFFFPHQSLAALEGKPKNWARNTGYGIWERNNTM